MVATHVEAVPFPGGRRPLTRRGLLLAPLLALPAPGIALGAPVMTGVPTSRRLKFDVMRGESSIGTHTLSFTVTDSTLAVEIAIKIAVSVGPVTVFRYDMQGIETWVNGQFASLTTTTNDDGHHHSVSIRRAAGGLLVQSAGFADRTVDAVACPLTHWSRAALSGPLLSPQDGQPIQGAITPLGRQSVTLADGRAVAVTGYDIAIHTPTRDWYDGDNIWVALDAKTRDGSVIHYRREA